jgi:hypothetical protein
VTDTGGKNHVEKETETGMRHLQAEDVGQPLEARERQGADPTQNLQQESSPLGFWTSNLQK